MTSSLYSITLAANLVACCLVLVLTGMAHHASLADIEQFATALASATEVAFDRILDGDPHGALKALAALARG
jgi:hypothetical protein